VELLAVTALAIFVLMIGLGLALALFGTQLE
jgi:hypothetical protein